MNEVLTDEKDIDDEIFWNYFKNQIPSFLAKDLITASQAKNEQLVNNINGGLIDLRNAIIRRETSENENPNKIVHIVEKFLTLINNKKVNKLKN